MNIKVFSRTTLKTFLEGCIKHPTWNAMDFDYEYPPKPSLVEDINPDKCLFISINNYSGAYFEQDEKGLELSPVPDKYKDNTCILHFDDVVEGCISTSHVPYKVFNKNMAKQIVEFLKKKLNDNIDCIVVHCTAGISRSGAVGTVLNEYYNKFLEDNPEDFHKFEYSGHERLLDPNPTVKRYLRRELGMSYK